MRCTKLSFIFQINFITTIYCQVQHFESQTSAMNDGTNPSNHDEIREVMIVINMKFSCTTIFLNFNELPVLKIVFTNQFLSCQELGLYLHSTFCNPELFYSYLKWIKDCYVGIKCTIYLKSVIIKLF